MLGHETVVVIGGGCAGVLTAAHLARQRQPVHVVIVDPGTRLGGGPAYNTDFPLHLLNTPAGEMSGLADRPDDFIEWAANTGQALTRGAFAPRALYGEYLSTLLGRVAAEQRHGSVVDHCRSTAIALVPSRDHPGSLLIGLVDGGHLVADRVVMAIGMAPSDPTWAACDLGPRFVADPWTCDAFEAIPDGANVLLVGTGLTMVDVAIELSERRQRLTLVARSRRGLLPLGHAPGRERRDSLYQPSGPALETSARRLVRGIRQEATKAESEGGDWRDIVTVARRHARETWQALPAAEQGRILRHALRHWEVHRHRMAPETELRLRRLTSSGVLEIRKGRVLRVDSAGRQFRAEVSSAQGHETLLVDAVVNCSGPSAFGNNQDRLISSLMGNHVLGPDENGFGLALSDGGDIAIDPGISIHTVGAIRRPLEFEATGVPEIRAQAAALAARVAG